MHDVYHARQITCMARNIYWESKNEPDEGQYLVAHVTRARALDDRPYWGGREICKVVHHRRTIVHFDPKTKKKKVWTVAEFSWTLLPQSRLVVTDEKAWQKAQKIAREVYRGKHTIAEDLGPVRYYMNPDKVDVCKTIAWFSDRLMFVRKVGLHDAYREQTTQEKRDLKGHKSGICA